MDEEPGEPTSDWSDPRASDADRDRFVDLLRYHYGTGMLDDEEFQRRLEAVLSARRLGDLYRVCRDLPFPPPSTGRHRR